MSRKPIHLEMIGGKGPRQRMWEAIRERAEQPWTLKDIACDRNVKCEVDRVREYVLGLTRAGFVKVASDATKGHNVPTSYVLERDNGVEAPRVTRSGKLVKAGLKQEQMWRVLRMLKGADINYRELAAHATTKDSPVDPVAANHYLRDLHGAKYLQCTLQGRGGGRRSIAARYRLVSDTGPKPPMVTRVNGIYDPNLGELIWIEPVNEETVIYGQ